MVVKSCVRGYHVYQKVWEAPVGEELVCKPQENNTNNCYAVAVVRAYDNEVVGHLPKKISRMCWLFLKKPRSVISCTVDGSRRYSADHPQGGMEIPITVRVICQEGEVQKLHTLLQMVSAFDEPTC
jgi:hypothetical protein